MGEGRYNGDQRSQHPAQEEDFTDAEWERAKQIGMIERSCRILSDGFGYAIEIFGVEDFEAGSLQRLSSGLDTIAQDYFRDSRVKGIKENAEHEARLKLLLDSFSEKNRNGV